MSSTTISHDYDTLRDAAGIVNRPGGVVHASGADVTTFLQSLVSNDLDAVADGGGARNLLLSPQGKLMVDFRALRVGAEEWWLDTDHGFGAALADGLNRFKIRVKVDIVDSSAEIERVTIRGGRAGYVLEAASFPTPPVQHAHAVSADRLVRVVRADWPSSPGFDLLGGAAAIADARASIVAAGAVECGADALEAVRVEAGIPRMGADIHDGTIPQEAFLEVDAVSFTKGCFLGQELVCRIDTRGHVNRYLRGLSWGDASVEVGAPVLAGDNEVGTITSAVQSPRLGGIGLATIRHEVEPPADVTVRTADGTNRPARALALPFT